MLAALVATLAFQLMVGVGYTWGALAPFALSQTHWTSLEVAMVFSGTPLGYGTGTVIGGRLADRLPPRRLLWLAWVAVAIGFLVAFTLRTPLFFIVFYGVLATGFGGGFAMAVSISAMRQVFPSRFGAAGGALSAVFAASALLLVPFVTLQAAAWGWVAALRLVCGILLAVGAAGLLLMPAMPRPVPHADAAHPPMLSLLPRGLVWSSLLVELLATPLGSYSFVHLSRLAAANGLALWVGSLAVSGFIAGNGLGRLVGGGASDRFGNPPVMAGMLLLSLSSAALAYLAHSPAPLLVGALFAGLGFGMPAGIMPRVAAEAAPDAPGTAFGLIFIGFTAGAFSGPLIGELLPAGAGGFLAMATIPLAGFLVLAMRRRFAL